MFVTSKQNGIDNSEVKLGLDILKSVVKVLVTDSERVRELKASLSKIIMVLSHGDDEELLECNKEMTKKYRTILLTPGTGLMALEEDIIRRKSFAEKYNALFLAAKCLSREINKERVMQVGCDLTKAGVEYVVGKINEDR